MALDTVILATQSANLQGYWKCDDAALSATLADASGNSKDLTLAGTEGTGYDLEQAGLIGNAVQFHGSGYASRTDSIIGNSPPEWTIFALINAAVQASTRLVAFASSTDNDPQIAMLSGASDATIRGFVRNDGNSSLFSNGGGSAFDSTWHSVVFRAGPSTFALFVDGVSVHSTNATIGANTITLDRTAIAALVRAAVGSHATVLMQHVAVWDIGLTTPEIEAIQDEIDAVGLGIPIAAYHYRRMRMA